MILLLMFFNIFIGSRACATSAIAGAVLPDPANTIGSSWHSAVIYNFLVPKSILGLQDHITIVHAKCKSQSNWIQTQDLCTSKHTDNGH